MLSDTADYALRALLVLARQPGRRALRADEIADAAGAPRNYMAKTLNALARAGLLTSTRGPLGGFVLAVPAADVSQRRPRRSRAGPLRAALLRPRREGRQAARGARHDAGDRRPVT